MSEGYLRIRLKGNGHQEWIPLKKAPDPEQAEELMELLGDRQNCRIYHIEEGTGKFIAVLTSEIAAIEYLTKEEAIVGR